MKIDAGHVVPPKKAASPDEPQIPGKGWRDKLAHALVDKVLPVGIFAFLSGMFWIGEHGLFSKLFYWAVALPALSLVIVQPGMLRYPFGSRVFVAYLPFAFYMALTLLWSASDNGAADLVKRPLYVLLLFIAVFEFGRRRFDRLIATIKWSAVFSVLAAIYTVARFFFSGGDGRLSGYGALFNPLLASHVFGFFLALWFGIYFSERKLFEPLSLFAIAIGVVLLLATGSRTPLLAMVVTIGWLAALSANRKSVLAVCATVIVGGGIWLFAPEVITQRGGSYRIEIWANAWWQIGEKFWFGHGYDAPLRIVLENFANAFSDPHNISLSVFYAGGVVGFVLWAGVYIVALTESWRWRSDKWVMACSATVMYGLVAGMTEGGSFLSRPKEHWFLIWIPLALLSVTTNRARANGKKTADWRRVQGLAEKTPRQKEDGEILPGAGKVRETLSGLRDRRWSLWTSQSA